MPRKKRGILDFLMDLDDLGVDDVFLTPEGTIGIASKDRVRAPAKLKREASRLFLRLGPMLQKECQLEYPPEDWDE